jgi:DNA-binding cell septation regulator SpoVG
MQVTNVKIALTFDGTLRAYADVTFDNSLWVREFRLLHTTKGYLLRMPNVRQPDGSSHDVASALNENTLKMIQAAVIAEYEKTISRSIRNRN